MSGELANALGDVSHVPKTEDSNYNDPPEFNHDLDTDQKPDIDNDEPSAPQEDEDMEDLFGDDKPAEEVVHHEGCVSKVSRSRFVLLNTARHPQGHNAGFL